MVTLVTKDTQIAKKIIQEGRGVAFPTGTCYGLAANALSGHALQRVRNLKQRPQEKPLSVFMAPALWDIYVDLTLEEKVFLQQHTGAALTLLVSCKPPLAHLTCRTGRQAHNNKVGLRVIDHPVMAQLAEIMQLPLTATSANITGEDPCYSTLCIQEKFPGRVGTTYDLSLGCILDGGNLQPGRVSTVAQLAGDGSITIIRQGALVLHAASHSKRGKLPEAKVQQ